VWADDQPEYVPYAVPMERVEVEVDVGTATYLRTCARRRGGSMATAAARQLRGLAVADSARQHAAWAAKEPEFFQDAEAERSAALSS
jgi:hypothetical protein